MPIAEGGGVGEVESFPQLIEALPSSDKFQPPWCPGIVATPSSYHRRTGNEWFASYYHTSTVNHHPMYTGSLTSVGYKENF